MVVIFTFLKPKGLRLGTLTNVLNALRGFFIQFILEGSETPFYQFKKMKVFQFV